MSITLWWWDCRFDKQSQIYAEFKTGEKWLCNISVRSGHGNIIYLYLLEYSYLNFQI